MQLRALEEKYKVAMMNSAQLDNEKQSLVYQVELFKDQLEEQAEAHTELQREYKDKNRVGLFIVRLDMQAGDDSWGIYAEEKHFIFLLFFYFATEKKDFALLWFSLCPVYMLTLLDVAV